MTWTAICPGLSGPHVVSLDDVLFVHATPGDDEECVTRCTPQDRLARIIEGVVRGEITADEAARQFEPRD